MNPNARAGRGAMRRDATSGRGAMQRDATSGRVRTTRGATLAAALVLALAVTGCAGGTKVRRSAKQMCEAHGGQYNAQTQQCSYVAQQRSARQNCEGQGGVYWPAEQYCEFEE